MKMKIKQILLVMMVVVGSTTSTQAQETKSTVESEKTVYKRIGLHADLSLSLMGLIEKQREWQGGDYHHELTLPRLNLTVGYRLNPYVSLDINLWSMILLSSAEFSPKINFTKTRISPFVSTAVGYGTALRIGPSDGPEEQDNSTDFTFYSAKVGVDGHMSKHTNLYASVGGMYNATNRNDRSTLERILITPEIGFQWKF